MKATWEERMEIYSTSVLCLSGLSSHSYPSKSTKDCDRVDKVIEYRKRIVTSNKVCQTHEHGGKHKGYPGNTSASALGENAGHSSVLGHAVECSRGDVLIRVGGGDGENQDAMIGRGQRSEKIGRDTYQAFMIAGRTLIPADSIATTKGEALAPPEVPFFAAWASKGEEESTIIPTKNEEKT